MTSVSNGNLGIVIPAYSPDTDILVSYLSDIKNTIDPATIRIEMDDPTDETVRTLQDCNIDIVISATEERRGKGKAITHGFDSLNTDYLLFADADGSTTADSLQSLANTIEKESVDIAVGTRRHPDSNVLTHQSHFRRFLGDTFVYLNQLVLHESLTDYQCGAKAFTSDTWNNIRPWISQPGSVLPERLERVLP